MNARKIALTLGFSLLAAVAIHAQSGGAHDPNAADRKEPASTNSVVGPPVTHEDGQFGELQLNGDSLDTAAGAVLRAKPSAGRPSVAVQTGSSDSTSSFRIFNLANSELMRVSSDGNVGIGTSPNVELHVKSRSGNSDKFKIEGNNTTNPIFRVFETTMGAGLLSLYHAGTENVRITSVGSGTTFFLNHNVKIGAPASAGFNVLFKDVPEPFGNGVLMEMQGNSRILVSNLEIGKGQIPVIDSTGTQLYLNSINPFDVVVGKAATATRLVVQGTGTSTFAGSVSVSGDLNVTGNVAAKYQDVAEWVPSEADFEPGTVVVLSGNRVNSVTAATTPYDTRVAGVVSAQPGLILGERGDSREMIATTGRVKVRVDASAAPIRIGDLLVTSDKPGIAMKSIPIDLQGVAFHRPGTVLGKALEPLESGEREILVLLSLQ